MKHIILAQNINTAKNGLQDIIKNIIILENSNEQTTLNINEIKINSNIYLDKLKNIDINISEVDEILSFISSNHKAIFKIFT